MGVIRSHTEAMLYQLHAEALLFRNPWKPSGNPSWGACAASCSLHQRLVGSWCRFRAACVSVLYFNSRHVSLRYVTLRCVTLPQSTGGTPRETNQRIVDSSIRPRTVANIEKIPPPATLSPADSTALMSAACIAVSSSPKPLIRYGSRKAEYSRSNVT